MSGSFHNQNHDPNALLMHCCAKHISTYFLSALSYKQKEKSKKKNKFLILNDVLNFCLFLHDLCCTFSLTLFI